MFFILSKLLIPFLRPLTWAVLLALWALWARPGRRKRRLATISVLVLVVFSNPWLINTLAGWWETRPPSGNPNVETAILLGGYLDFDATVPPELIQVHRSGNRLLTALQLYKQGRVRRILVSGGSGHLFRDEPIEAVRVADFLREMGVPDSALLVEGRSRNTRENALFSKQLLDSAGLVHQPAFLVTSAWHMPRALRHFHRAGLSPTPFPTDFLTEKRHFFQWFAPEWEALQKWELLLKEWIGYMLG